MRSQSWYINAINGIKIQKDVEINDVTLESCMESTVIYNSNYYYILIYNLKI